MDTEIQQLNITINKLKGNHTTSNNTVTNFASSFSQLNTSINTKIEGVDNSITTLISNQGQLTNNLESDETTYREIWNEGRK
jgi:hypothetical protein